VKDILTYVGRLSEPVVDFCTGISAKEPYLSAQKYCLPAQKSYLLAVQDILKYAGHIVLPLALAYLQKSPISLHKNPVSSPCLYAQEQ